MGLFWEGYVYQFGTRGACAPRSTPGGLARARADARAACSNHFVFQSSDQGEAGEVYWNGGERRGQRGGHGEEQSAKSTPAARARQPAARAPAGGARVTPAAPGSRRGSRARPLMMMMMMMMTFITREGEGQGKTKKERKATKSEGRGLEEGASRALMRQHGEGEGVGRRAIATI